MVVMVVVVVVATLVAGIHHAGEDVKPIPWVQFEHQVPGARIGIVDTVRQITDPVVVIMVFVLVGAPMHCVERQILRVVRGVQVPPSDILC